MGEKIKRKKQQKVSSSYAVTSVLETLILLSMTVGFFIVLYLMVFSFSFAPLPPSVHIMGTTDGDDIILYHQGGDPLPMESSIILRIEDKQSKLTVGDYLDAEAKKDSQWDMGEQLVIPGFDPSDHHGNIMVVDGDTNAMVFYGNF